LLDFIWNDDVLRDLAQRDGGYLRALADELLAGRTTRDGIPLEQILSDRPDVFRAYYESYYGAGNDKHSDAWVDRVGGVTAQDYANYWYEQHGRWEGYGRDSGGVANAPLEDDGSPHLMLGVQETGRTTFDGIPLSQILSDRPDVFRAFYTEYYGANNDQRSSAWVDRVGGTTVEDYANYWYERYGKWGDYTPHKASPPPAPGADGEPAPGDEPPLPPVDTSEDTGFEYPTDGAGESEPLSIATQTMWDSDPFGG